MDLTFDEVVVHLDLERLEDIARGKGRKLGILSLLKWNCKMSGRDFLNTSAVASITARAICSLCLYVAGNEELKVFLIGCEGRGKDALKDYHSAAKRIGLGVKVIHFSF